MGVEMEPDRVGIEPDGVGIEPGGLEWNQVR